MEPDIWPLDPASAAALVIRVIEDLDSSTEEQRDTLLCELLQRTWGSSLLAQNQ